MTDNIENNEENVELIVMPSRDDEREVEAGRLLSNRAPIPQHLTMFQAMQQQPRTAAAIPLSVSGVVYGITFLLTFLSCKSVIANRSSENNEPVSSCLLNPALLSMSLIFSTALALIISGCALHKFHVHVNSQPRRFPGMD